MDKLARVIGKMQGNMIFQVQSEESVPRIVHEFSATSVRCYRPGIVNLHLKAGMPTSRMALEDMVRDFPRTLFPYKTYDIAFFDVHPETVGAKLKETT